MLRSSREARPATKVTPGSTGVEIWPGTASAQAVQGLNMWKPVRVRQAAC